MEIGKVYLIETVDWFAWVGRVQSQVGPYEYRMVSVSKIHDTSAGDNWELLAAGDKAARKAAQYRHYTTSVLLGIGAVAKIEWAGGTPQEEGL